MLTSGRWTMQVARPTTGGTGGHASCLESLSDDLSGRHEMPLNQAASLAGRGRFKPSYFHPLGRPFLSSRGKRPALRSGLAEDAHPSPGQHRLRHIDRRCSVRLVTSNVSRRA